MGFPSQMSDVSIGNAMGLDAVIHMLRVIQELYPVTFLGITANRALLGSLGALLLSATAIGLRTAATEIAELVG